jgi:hypothetical protein
MPRPASPSRFQWKLSRLREFIMNSSKHVLFFTANSDRVVRES